LIIIRLSKTWPNIRESHLYYGRYKSLPHIAVQTDPNWISQNNYDKKHELTQKYERGEIERNGGAGNTPHKIIGGESQPNRYIKYIISL
jgi:hypothetical protein